MKSVHVLGLLFLAMAQAGCGGGAGNDSSITISQHFASTEKAQAPRRSANAMPRLNQTAVSEDAIEGEVFRIYQAAFNRVPDANGLQTWIDFMYAGHSLEQVSWGFTNSDEFKSLYGVGVSSAQFVTRLYANVLHRAPDGQGFASWVSALDSGAWTREQLLIGFSESQENKDNTRAAFNRWFNPPLPVLPTSYENRMAAVAAIGPQTIPHIGNLPGWNTVAYAFGDFFQDGTYTLVTHTQVSDNSKPYEEGAVHGRIKFWKKDRDGAWVDRTGDLVSDDSGCILARKVLVADFNGDSIPDAYFSCSGFDAPPFEGEPQRLLLSDAATRKYRNIVVPVTGYAHGASAADIDQDGSIDIVVADMRGNGSKNPLYVLKGKGDGSFSVDYSLIDRPEIRWQANGPVWTVELIDFDRNGTYSIVAGGDENATQRSIIIPYDAGAKNYATKPLIVLPGDPTYVTPYDFIFDSTTNSIYVDRVNSLSNWGSNWPSNVGNSIQKINYKTLEASTIFTHSGFYNQLESLTWIEWIGLYENRIVALNAGFGVSLDK